MLEKFAWLYLEGICKIADKNRRTFVIFSKISNDCIFKRKHFDERGISPRLRMVLYSIVHMIVTIK